ncbi:MAG: hypothetical protein WCJ30_18280 [Deltaproteobacteria bacterium]
MPTKFHEARIARIDAAARDQTLLSLEADPAHEATHLQVGQYCLLRLDERNIEGHFVLIDPPGEGPFRFLLRSGGAAADALRDAESGARVSVRGPLGKGFPIEKAHGRDVLLVSAGSGLAAIRPLLLALEPFGTRRVWLFHGTRTLDHVPFSDDLRRAQDAGLQLTVAVSGKSEAAVDRRVQHAIRRAGPDLSNAVAFVSGMQPMIDELRAELPTLGLAADAIYLNH